jgi:hypothetical protein
MRNHVESGDENTATHRLVFGIAREPKKINEYMASCLSFLVYALWVCLLTERNLMNHLSSWTAQCTLKINNH